MHLISFLNYLCHDNLFIYFLIYLKAEKLQGNHSTIYNYNIISYNITLAVINTFIKL